MWFLLTKGGRQEENRTSDLNLRVWKKFKVIVIIFQSHSSERKKRDCILYSDHLLLIVWPQWPCTQLQYQFICHPPLSCLTSPTPSPPSPSCGSDGAGGKRQYSLQGSFETWFLGHHFHWRKYPCTTDCLLVTQGLKLTMIQGLVKLANISYPEYFILQIKREISNYFWSINFHSWRFYFFNYWFVRGFFCELQLTWNNCLLWKCLSLLKTSVLDNLIKCELTTKLFFYIKVQYDDC